MSIIYNMDKILHIKVPEDTYYRLIELKGRFKAKDWSDFMEKVVKRCH